MIAQFMKCDQYMEQGIKVQLDLPQQPISKRMNNKSLPTKQLDQSVNNRCVHVSIGPDIWSVQAVVVADVLNLPKTMPFIRTSLSSLNCVSPKNYKQPIISTSIQKLM